MNKVFIIFFEKNNTSSKIQQKLLFNVIHLKIGSETQKEKKKPKTTVITKNHLSRATVIKITERNKKLQAFEELF